MSFDFTKIQHKVYKEISDVYAQKSTDDESLSPEDLSKMVYLERVIKETLRVFPTAPLIARLISEDLELGEQF